MDIRSWIPAISVLVLSGMAIGAQQNEIINLKHTIARQTTIQEKQVELREQVVRTEEQLKSVKSVSEENKQTLKLIDQRLLLLLQRVPQ